MFFFVKQKTAYEMRISDWSSDVCSSDLRVDFSRYAELAPDHQPRKSLDDSIDRLVQGLSRTGFNDRDFRNSSLMRLKVLESHMAAGRLSDELHWLPSSEKVSA